MKFLIKLVANKVLTNRELIEEAVEYIRSRLRIDYDSKFARKIFDIRIKHGIERFYNEYLEGFESFNNYQRTKNRLKDLKK